MGRGLEQCRCGPHYVQLKVRCGPMESRCLGRVSARLGTGGKWCCGSQATEGIVTSNAGQEGRGAEERQEVSGITQCVLCGVWFFIQNESLTLVHVVVLGGYPTDLYCCAVFCCETVPWFTSPAAGGHLAGLQLCPVGRMP